MSTDGRLQQVGELLYGPQWQSAIARDLNVNDRTVRRWLSGASPMPDGVRLELQELCLKRLAELQRLVGEF